MSDRQQRRAAAATPADMSEFPTKSVAIAGLGNIGSHLAPLVARLNVGRLVLVDRDRLERHNDNQDFSLSDAGECKAVLVADRLRRDFPGMRVEAYAADLEDVPLGALDVDVLLGALDSRRARQVLACEIAWPMGIPVVDGGVGEGLLGRVQVFLPGPDTACLECGWSAADYRHLAAELPCRANAAAASPATVSPAFEGAVVAGLMAAECLRILGGEVSASSRELAFDLAHQRFLPSRLRRAAGCRFDHEIVSETIPLGKNWQSARVSDLVSALERRYGGVPVHLEPRRGLPSADQGPEARHEVFTESKGRFVAVEQLRPLAEQSLAALGFTAADRVRVRAGQSPASAYVVWRDERKGASSDN